MNKNFMLSLVIVSLQLGVYDSHCLNQSDFQTQVSWKESTLETLHEIQNKQQVLESQVEYLRHSTDPMLFNLSLAGSAFATGLFCGDADNSAGLYNGLKQYSFHDFATSLLMITLFRLRAHDNSLDAKMLLGVLVERAAWIGLHCACYLGGTYTRHGLSKASQYIKNRYQQRSLVCK